MIEPFKFEKFGRYILVKKMAMGGMAEIFLAKTEKKEDISQFVVLKRILPQFSSNRKFKAMFKMEGKITSHLRHNNMVYHHEFGIEKGIYYIVMEHILGCSLKEFLNKTRKSSSKFPIPIAVSIVQSIASALHYIHNSVDPETGKLLSLIHRDVTPHNIMIGFNGDIKLIDFGIAKVSGVDLTNSGVVKGKFSYMSPEQISGVKIDYKSDIFSLGVVLWELLSGRKLFSGDNIQSVFGKIRDCRLPNISHIRPGISPQLMLILKKMLEKNCNNRYQQANAVEKDLHLFLNKKYPNFSQVDCQNFIRKICEDDIIKERTLMVSISTEISQMGLQQSSQNQGLSPAAIPLMEEEERSSLSAGNGKNQHEDSSQLSQTANSSSVQPIKKTTVSPLEGDPTLVAKKAPISYVKTQLSKNAVFGKNDLDDITTYKTELSEDTHARRSSSSFDSLREIYKETERERNKSYYKTALVVIIVAISVVYFLNPIKLTEKLLKGKGDVARTADFDELTHPTTEDIENSFEEQELSVNSEPEEIERTAEQEEPYRNLAMNKPQGFFSVYVETNPSGANVYLNGNKVEQQTPVLIDVPRAGSHFLEVRREGYKPYILKNLSASSNVEVKLKKIRRKKKSVR